MRRDNDPTDRRQQAQLAVEKAEQRSLAEALLAADLQHQMSTQQGRRFVGTLLHVWLRANRPVFSQNAMVMAHNAALAGLADVLRELLLDHCPEQFHQMRQESRMRAAARKEER
jgi:hypothetical protein